MYACIFLSFYMFIYRTLWAAPHLGPMYVCICYINMHRGPTYVFIYNSFFLYVHLWYVMSSTTSGSIYVCICYMKKCIWDPHMYICIFLSFRMFIYRTSWAAPHLGPMYVCICYMKCIWDPHMYVCIFVSFYMFIYRTLWAAQHLGPMYLFICYM